MMEIGLNHYLVLSTILFSIGLVGVMRRKNLLMLFFATEILLNSVNISFAAKIGRASCRERVFRAV